MGHFSIDKPFVDGSWLAGLPLHSELIELVELLTARVDVAGDPPSAESPEGWRAMPSHNLTASAVVDLHARHVVSLKISNRNWLLWISIALVFFSF